MSESQFRNMAAQLRKPDGEMGRQIGAKMNVSNELLNRKTIAELHISPAEKILELGMGNGFFVKDILESAKEVKYVGCDYSETMLAEAKELNREFIETGKTEFYLATADNLPFEKEIFDKAFGVNIIYFWEKPEKELAEIHRVLKPNGKLVIAIRPKETMQFYPFTQFGFNMYSKEELCKLLNNNSFEVENIIDEQEPAQEVNGNKVEVAMLIVKARKA